MARRNDIDSKAVITIKSKAGSGHVDVRLEFDPPLPGPANDDQRYTIAQEVANTMLASYADQIAEGVRKSGVKVTRKQPKTKPEGGEVAR